MKPEKDAYGKEVLAYFKNQSSSRLQEIIERDDGFFDVSGGPKAYFEKYEEWPKYEKIASKFAKGRVLDVGCGAGRVALHLQRKGHKVTGIDNSPLAAKVCKLRGLKNVKLMPIGEIGQFSRNSFDTIIMFGNNFGLFESPKNAKILLKKFHKITSREAIILAESRDPYKTKDPYHLNYHKFNKRRGRMPGQLKIRVRFATYASEWFDYLLVSKNEMRKIITGSGWKIIKFIGGADGSYIAVIKKSKL